ncbi:hypothetical protein CEXT_285301 [Caerostris extrusa]|uniref:Uncharacterized protein n=1 Tax=Caerostris extrusa TaxID=172846 RepID=A0AAV4P5Y9_CAEEX|nr:hypothetical protein CEXT_285301 [Caerostris extrusa]
MGTAEQTIYYLQGNGREAIENGFWEKSYFCPPSFLFLSEILELVGPTLLGCFYALEWIMQGFLCHHAEKYGYSSSYCRTHSLPQPLQKIRKSFTR